MTRPIQPTPGVIVCSIGCCPGCQFCFGMSIGCHQEPCRCDLPCTCRYEAEDSDPAWREGCERHDDRDDQRRIEAEQEAWTPDELDTLDDDLARARGGPCPDCGAPGACGWDDEGRPLIHAQGADE